jgi:CheY-like chemotaxis protein
MDTLTVLVVEDEKVTRRFIVESLRRCGYLVQCCPDGLSGLKLLEKETFDIILIDVFMPVMNGKSNQSSL